MIKKFLLLVAAMSLTACSVSDGFSIDASVNGMCGYPNEWYICTGFLTARCGCATSSYIKEYVCERSGSAAANRLIDFANDLDGASANGVMAVGLNCTTLGLGGRKPGSRPTSNEGPDPYPGPLPGPIPDPNPGPTGGMSSGTEECVCD